MLDPITNFLSVGGAWEVKSLLTRVLDQVRGTGATALLTSLTPGTGTVADTETGISSMMDTWIALENQVSNHVRHCNLFVLKSRGMAHSHEERELIISSSGLSLRPLPASARQRTVDAGEGRR